MSQETTFQQAVPVADHERRLQELEKTYQLLRQSCTTQLRVLNKSKNPLRKWNRTVIKSKVIV